MNIGEYALESPLMNAGGLVKSLEDVRMMAATSVSAVVAGSYTLDERVGNSPDGQTVYHHDVSTGITYNALGMPNKGLEAAADDLPEMIATAHDNGKPFVLNFAPVTTNPVAEVIAMSEILSRRGITELDGFELNASCPNVVTSDGGRHELLSHHSEQLGRVLFELSDVFANEINVGTAIVRVSPFRSTTDALMLAGTVEVAGFDAIAAFNTFPGGVPLDAKGKPILQVPGGAGGQSGPGMRRLAETQTKWLEDARQKVGASFDIIGSNGIATGEDIKTRLELGASAVSATTLFWQARSWGHAADRILQEYAQVAS